MQRLGDTYVLERAELIYLNRLVRGKIDVCGFLEWYHSVSEEEQKALIIELYTFALQTGFHTKVWDQVVEQAKAPPDSTRMMQSIFNDAMLGLGKLLRWLTSASAQERLAAFPLFVWLFGESEKAVRNVETEGTCNHWWHRDLHDPVVIADLMSNPKWYATSPRDDRKNEHDF